MAFAALVPVVQREVRELTPAALSPAEALAELEAVAKLKKLVDAATVLLAQRAAETPEWQRRGFRSEAEWLALLCGTSVRDANHKRETSARIAEGRAPATEAAMRAGDLSAEQASATSSAAVADPSCEEALVGRAKLDSLHNTRQEAARRQAAAEDETERRARLHQTRGLFTGRHTDGAATGWWRCPPETQAVAAALLKPFFEAELDRARREGRREPFEAYRLDALMVMLRLAAQAIGTAAPRPGSSADAAAAPVVVATADAQPAASGEPPELPLAEIRDGLVRSVENARAAMATRRQWRNTKVIVRVDHAALIRRRTEPGEICEIAGVGPVPVAAVHDMLLSGDPFVAAIVTRGVDVSAVAHLGRGANAYQQTALQWRDTTCVVETCSAAPRDIDHHIDWADCRQTTVDNLGAMCDHHHDLKTHKRYRITPSTIPGKIRLAPPPDDQPP